MGNAHIGHGEEQQSDGGDKKDHQHGNVKTGRPFRKDQRFFRRCFIAAADKSGVDHNPEQQSHDFRNQTADKERNHRQEAKEIGIMLFAFGLQPLKIAIVAVCVLLHHMELAGETDDRKDHKRHRADDPKQ